jgi:enediyne polyketide synthase
MLGRPVTVRHRPDGKPETAEDLSVSSAHGAGLTFAVSGEGTVGCDVEPVRERTAAEWGALLGPAQLALSELVSRERGEELSAAATRVWGAVESLRKIGRASPGPITLAERGMDSWVVLHSGDARIATFSTRVAGTAGPVVFSVLAEARSSR